MNDHKVVPDMPDILVVEDYADLRSALVSTLVRAHYHCDGVRNSDDAVTKLREHRYGAVLLTPRLPISEDPVVRYAMADPSHAPKIILMTEGESDDEYRSLTKPFNNEELFAKLTS
jgi:DNA-binding response OmpR family regulator